MGTYGHILSTTDDGVRALTRTSSVATSSRVDVWKVHNAPCPTVAVASEDDPMAFVATENAARPESHF
jgi:hypothetical protein